MSTLKDLKSHAHVAWLRLHNRWMDLHARAAGACNADLWTGEPPTGYSGGYSHWRCGRKRGHAAPHRFNNYTWTGEPGEGSMFDPLPVRTAGNSGLYNTTHGIPFVKLTGMRHGVDTRRRSRLRARWAEESLQRRIAERQ